ncbi:RNA polymerase factor sigma-54 [Bacillus suaedaesalsae]|uniref:RNA polymerase factor sigma-54 n=1 Tax=Bacillus suaedaesalsae TaxID=2810349 RepID=A0ABS2DKL4_9BACI|nr:RNA polymerase factor sigma-54 [Bacillus suaedaesalsae]MBM6618998.1 RNA polymerase factor sigma-54 [Bacillus suaedaesalsae]
MKTGLLQQQVTKLALTNELRQSITLLQYSSYELSQFITDLSLRNPFVKINDKVYKAKSLNKKIDKELVSHDQPSLDHYVKSQLDVQNLDTALKNKIIFLVNSIDEEGYIRDSMDELSELSGYSESELLEALHYIQAKLEPAGIGAQSLQQSLSIQLHRKFPTSIIAHKVVEHYFIQLAEKKWDKISKELAITIEEVQQVFQLLQTLNPRPAADFKKVDIPYIVPDVFIEQDENGYKVSINERAHLAFTIDDEYLSLQQEIDDKESLDYLKEKYNEAKWVYNSIEQRKRTMVLVTQAILLRQKEFFQYGVAFLVPLTLREIAADVELHESTISRTVRGKYVQTHAGTFELKYFFHSKIKSTYNKEISSVRVKEIIKQMITGEEKKKPLSDQKISIQLETEYKLKVSRRTVAKYREQLRIPSSSSRKFT